MHTVLLKNHCQDAQMTANAEIKRHLVSTPPHPAHPQHPRQGLLTRRGGRRNISCNLKNASCTLFTTTEKKELVYVHPCCWKENRS
mmetsp:Transcript_26127/g.49514  ORF Transcript_26127/g.49514 Transcript_26127/m.49514 type:complete len:86 (+) Transcript_26127:771-1028(+)